jgi:hypothetical protein
MTQPGIPYAPNQQPNSNGYRTAFIGLAVVLVLAIIIVLVVVLTSKDDSASAAEIRTEPVSTASSDPFAPAPVGTDQAIPPVQPTGTVTVEGGHVGLYGGTLNTTTCDKNQLTVFLRQNPAKASAWAGTLGITVTQIPSYINGLTPVLLRSDTIVTNHGYSNGQATVIPAVLQAGTAVLVDDKGFPVTKCYCGNPLTPPTYYQPGYHPRYHGPRWPGFSGTSITIIQNNTTIIDTFTLVDPKTKQAFKRPKGTDGSSDTPAATPQPVATPTPEPSALPTVEVPPVTQAPLPEPPVTQAPVPSGPTAEELAIQKLNNGSAQCYPFPAPIEQGYGDNDVSTSLNDPNQFVLTVVTHQQDGSPLQTFTWSVERATLTFTPTNDLAQVASDHCSLLR